MSRKSYAHYEWMTNYKFWKMGWLASPKMAYNIQKINILIKTDSNMLWNLSTLTKNLLNKIH